MASEKGLPLTSDLYELLDYPAKGFALELKTIEDLDRVVDNAFKVVDHLYQNDVAHNVFITRARSLSANDDEAVRITIWARQSVKGYKEPGDFCVAVCELAGQMLIYDQEAYDKIDQDRVAAAHQETCLHETVKPAIKQLFR